MTELSLHIRYLLRRHDCVIVPGIGAFIVSRTPAVFDIEHLKVTPPMQTVTFNPALNVSDGLLAGSVARRDGISFADATEMVAHKASMIRNALHRGESIKFDGTGALIPGDEGTMTFVADDNQDEMFGIIELGQSADAKVDNEVLDEAEDGFISRNPGRYYFSISKKFVHIAASLLIILSIGAAIAIPVMRNGLTVDNQASVLPVKHIVKEIPTIAPTEKPVEKAAPEQKAEAPVSARFHLVVATFHTMAEAEAFVAQHPDDNLTVVASKTLYRVSAKSADDESALREYRRSIVSTYPDCWIYTE